MLSLKAEGVNLFESSEFGFRLMSRMAE